MSSAAVQLQPYLVCEPHVEGEEERDEHACGDGKDPSEDDDDVEDGEDTCGRLKGEKRAGGSVKSEGCCVCVC